MESILLEHFYDPSPVEDWRVEILTKFKEQFYKRVAEAPSMLHAQWIKLAQSRRTESEDDLDNTRIQVYNRTLSQPETNLE